ncbi:MAG: glycine dehydrogenase [Betaproteobacteria bacterium]|nr:glycine dehydrogenase [Betaproteobacteria bacterium]
MPFIPHTEEDLRAMLKCIGVRDLASLFEDIPPQFKPKSFALPEGLSEMETCEHFERLAARNKELAACFLGAGFYDHHIPKAVDALAGRSEFVTAYTPYQAESSQGTLQAIFEYQTAMTRLFEMDCANASVYDGGSALFEAAMMAVRWTKRCKLVVDEALNPIWRGMLNSYTASLGLDIVTVPHNNGRSDIDALKKAVGMTEEADSARPWEEIEDAGDATPLPGKHENCAAVLVQNPNFFGIAQDFSTLFAHAKNYGALSVISAYPVMQAVLKTPGEMGADVAVADGQALGMPLSFGGPYLGIMTCKKELIRQFPGRIAGRTHDMDGKTGYVLTLQAREQHIRRAKATSNICSNQALCALRSLVHLCLLGPRGLVRSAELGMERAREAAARLCGLPGVQLLNDAPFGNEFAVRLPSDAAIPAERCARRGCVPGLPLGRYYPAMRDVLLVACTEKTTSRQIDLLVEEMRAAL